MHSQLEEKHSQNYIAVQRQYWWHRTCQSIWASFRSRWGLEKLVEREDHVFVFLTMINDCHTCRIEFDISLFHFKQKSYFPKLWSRKTPLSALTSYNLCSLEKNILFSSNFIFSKVSLGSSLQLLERSLRGFFLYGGEPVNQWSCSVMSDSLRFQDYSLPGS